jgi:hypothetical protein
VDQQKTRAERHAEREAELERQDRESSAALARISLAQQLGVRLEDLTEEQLAASDLQTPPRRASSVSVGARCAQADPGGHRDNER